MRKITVSKIFLSTLLSSVAISASLITTSCSSELSISTKNVEINPNTGKGVFTISLPEQPLHDEAVVTITNKTNRANDVVQLLEPEGQPYFDGKPSVTYDVSNRKITVYASFAGYHGQTATSDFDLNIQYKTMSKIKKNDKISNIELSVNYKQDPNQTLHVLSLNDLHGASAGYGDEFFNSTSSKNPGIIRIAQEFAKTLEAEENRGSVVLTCGDNTSGEAFSTSVHAESSFNVLKSMGAMYSAVGNHEFEWGLDLLSQGTFDNWGRTDNTLGHYFTTANILNFEYWRRKTTWCADPTDTKNFEHDYNIWSQYKVRWADPYKILNLDGHLVCLIGLTTKLSDTDGNREATGRLSFINYNASVQYANYLCKQELGDWYDNIETFILLTHIESEGDEQHKPIYDPAVDDAVTLAATCTLPKLGGVLSAHSHKIVCGTVHNDELKRDIWVGQSETAGRQYIDTKLEFNNLEKPGHRLTNLTMELKPIPLDNSSFFAAGQELKHIRETTTSELVKNVIKEYDIQKEKVKSKLRTVVAHRDHGLAYPVCQHHPGHEYFCSSQICDQLGAWVSLAQLCGFTSAYREDIVKGTVKLPAISLFTIDSASVELSEPKVHPTNVTLKELYSIQSYENPMWYGQVSVWQLGKIIDYALSGATKFNYTSNNDYFSTDFDDPKSLNNLQYDAKANPNGDPLKVCENFPEVSYKGTQVRCNYLPGPLQWYGFRCQVQPMQEEEAKKYDRKYELVYEDVDQELAKKYKTTWGITFTKIPKIWIYDPVFDASRISTFENIYEPDKWLSCSEWLDKYIDTMGLIPCVVNSFIYTGGNSQNTLFANYFAENQSAVGYSKLSREMLEEFCALTESPDYKNVLHFDLSNALVQKLITGYSLNA